MRTSAAFKLSFYNAGPSITHWICCSADSVAPMAYWKCLSKTLHQLLSSPDSSMQYIFGINTAQSHPLLQAHPPRLPCQLLLVLLFHYGSPSTKTNCLGKVNGARYQDVGSSLEAHRESCWWDSTGISCWRLSREALCLWLSTVQEEEKCLEWVLSLPRQRCNWSHSSRTVVFLGVVPRATSSAVHPSPGDAPPMAVSFPQRHSEELRGHT